MNLFPFINLVNPAQDCIFLTFKCDISELIDKTERWHWALREDKFLQNVSKQQDCIKIANQKVIFHLEQEKNSNFRIHVSALKLQYLRWSSFGKNSSMKEQNLLNTEWVDGPYHISILAWKN